MSNLQYSIIKKNPTPIRQCRTREEFSKFLYRCAHAEEMMMKLHIYEIYVIDQLDQAVDRLEEHILQNHKNLFRQTFKYNFNHIRKNSDLLNIETLAFERQALMDVIAHGAPSLRNQFDKIGCLSADILTVYEENISRLLLVWQNTTNNLIARVTSDRKEQTELIKLLYLVNGWATLGITAEESVYEQACKDVGASNVVFSTATVNRYRTILNSTVNMLINLGFKGEDEHDYWYKQARQALFNLSNRMMSIEILKQINHTLWLNQKTYLKWFISKCCLIMHDKGKLPDDVLKDLKRQMVGREYGQLLMCIRAYSKRVHTSDPWLFIQQMEAMTEDKPFSLPRKFVERALKWTEGVTAKCNEKRAELEDIYYNS